MAALLVAIGRPSASRLLKHFTADDLRSLAVHARKLEPITPSDFEELVKQFENAFADGAPVSEAGMRFEGLLRESLTADEASAVIENRRPELLAQESVWDQLPRIPAEILHAYLVNQHPQVTAYVISRLPSDIAAKSLIRFSPTTRSALIQRTLHIRKVAPSCLRHAGSHSSTRGNRKRQYSFRKEPSRHDREYYQSAGKIRDRRTAWRI